MDRLIRILRALTVSAMLAGTGFLVAPARAGIAGAAVAAADTVRQAPTPSGVNADSLAEDVILFNLFTPSRSAPPGRTNTTASPASPAGEEPAVAESGFRPALIGTAVSDRPGETRALLQLDPADPSPRLYGIGDQAGGYRVVSITAREVVVSGPRGRIVLRLPQREEENS